MITNGTYEHLDRFRSKEEIFNFINSDGNKFSNYTNYDSMVQKLVNYKAENSYNYKPRKDGKKYGPIYADMIKIGVPKCLEKRQFDEYIRKYLNTYDVRLKNLLWIAKIVKEGKGTYIIAMVFSRRVFSKPEKEQEIYTRDYFYNKKTGQTCKADDPNAILKRKKGELKFNKDGTPVMKIKLVEDVEERVFRAKSWTKMNNRLHELIEMVAKEMCPGANFYTKIAKHTIKDDYSENLKNSFRKRNRFIDTIINEKLIRFQEGIIQAKIDETDESIFALFYELVEKVDSIMSGKSKEDFNNIEGIMNNWWEQNILGYSVI